MSSSGKSFRVCAEDLDLTLCVTSGQVFRWQVVGEQEWVGVDGDNWYRARQSERGAFEVTSNASLRAFQSLFRLDQNLDTIKRTIIDRGPELAGPIRRLEGLRLTRPSSIHETLFCFLCTANNNLPRITSMVRKLGEHGELLADLPGYRLYRFPTVERIAAIREDELRNAGFGYRAKSIPAAARQIQARGSGWLESLKKLPYAAARSELLFLSGVGPKLADCMALYALDKTESVPVDTHLWQAICRSYFPEWHGKTLTDARYRAGADFLRERFGEHAGLAHLYLYLDNMLHGVRKPRQSP